MTSMKTDSQNSAKKQSWHNNNTVLSYVTHTPTTLTSTTHTHTHADTQAEGDSEISKHANPVFQKSPPSYHQDMVTLRGGERDTTEALLPVGHIVIQGSTTAQVPVNQTTTKTQQDC